MDVESVEHLLVTLIRMLMTDERRSRKRDSTEHSVVARSASRTPSVRKL